MPARVNRRSPFEKNRQYAASHRRQHRRHLSSKLEPSNKEPTETEPAFRNPLHRDPSRISSSVGSIYRPPGYFLGVDNKPVLLPADDTAVIESVRSCIKIDEGEDGSDETEGGIDHWTDGSEQRLRTEMSLCFLGTGAGSPASIRSTSGTFLRLARTTFMFDVGEGTQRQFQFAKGSSSLSKIDKIFISHLHGDHIFGLPGFLLSMQTSLMQVDDSARKTNKARGRRRQGARGKEEFTVEIYGPPGLFNYISSSITLSCTRLHLLNVHVYELVGGRVRRVVTPPPSDGRHLPRGSSRQQRNNNHTRDPFHSDYPEFRHNGGRLRRFEIPCRNGVWDIQDNARPATREDLLALPSNRGRGSRGARGSDERVRIRAAEVDHMPGVATFGFVVEEAEPPRNLDVAKARALGVSHKNKKYELLKHGFAVTSDDGSERQVEPHQVLKAATKKARKIAVIGDNRGWTPQMAEIARKADVLVHEATLVEEDPSRGHSTASMVGRKAAECGAKLLVLNHISPRMESTLSEVVREAYDACGRQLSVLMSFDFMELAVPWMGFGTTDGEGGDAGDEGEDEDETKRKTPGDWTRSVFSESKGSR